MQIRFAEYAKELVERARGGEGLSSLIENTGEGEFYVEMEKVQKAVNGYIKSLMEFR